MLRVDPLMTQMEQWSILSNILNYVKHNKYYISNHNLDIKMVNKHKDKESIKLDFDDTPLKLCKEYLDVSDGIQTEIVNTSRFNENSDLSTIYLGRSGKARHDKLKAEESFPISEHGYTSGKLLDGTECQLLLDTGTSKSFISKSFYMQCKSFHSLPKLTSKTQRIQVANRQCRSVLFDLKFTH